MSVTVFSYRTALGPSLEMTHAGIGGHSRRVFRYSTGALARQAAESAVCIIEHTQ